MGLHESAEGEGLIAADSGQQVFREIVAEQLEYIARDNGGVPTQAPLRHWAPSKVIVDLGHSFGQPVFAGTRVRVADVAGMMKAGERAETVAAEFGIPVSDARTAARILLGRAA